ncbi:DEAD/DEAH box helicase [Actinophytocola xanthii]|uniref:hypothetical protein n=1 Tax=Actinophytocola xanthii TaxID=1912961 RepID=UPI001E64470A|nr:hypothetical protein [Actinophytocola xanthii]
MSAHAHRQVQQRADTLLRRSFPGMPPLPRRVLTALLARTAEGWHLFVRTGRTGADAFLVGPTGVTALVIAETPPDQSAAQALARHADERCVGLRVSADQVLTGAAVRHVVVVPEPGTPDTGTFQVLAEKDLDRLFRRAEPRLPPRQAAAIADLLGRRLSGYERLVVPRPERPAAPEGFLDAGQLAEDELDAAQERPFETWMTFLHPDQQKIVTRRYGGPARISGPAGTGKTVVALHRLRHLATRTVGPLLCTTFVHNLPPVYRTLFERLAPTLAGRVEFVNLHAWARGFLAGRGVAVNLVSGQVDSAFSRAWIRHRERLGPVHGAPLYWRTEIDRVIKGRGLTSLAEYRAVNRRGRALPLDGENRTAVWRLYETYQENLARDGLHDHNDLVHLARPNWPRRRPTGRTRPSWSTRSRTSR